MPFQYFTLQFDIFVDFLSLTAFQKILNLSQSMIYTIYFDTPICTNIHSSSNPVTKVCGDKPGTDRSHGMIAILLLLSEPPQQIFGRQGRHSGGHFTGTPPFYIIQNIDCLASHGGPDANKPLPILMNLWSCMFNFKLS